MSLLDQAVSRPLRVLARRYRERVATDARARHEKRLADGATHWGRALDRCPDPIPVIVVSFENGAYVLNMCRQLRERGLTPIVIDNGSRSRATVEALARLEAAGDATVVRIGFNGGHLIGFEPLLYRALPDVFAYTDPDLQFDPALPDGFLETLAAVARQYRVFKAGCALHLPDGERVSDAMYTHTVTHPIAFEGRFSIPDWERHFWRQRLAHDTLDVWAADVDTTFAVYRKENYRGDFFDAVRVAGPYSVLHLPWFPSRALLSPEDLAVYQRENRSSTWR